MKKTFRKLNKKSKKSRTYRRRKTNKRVIKGGEEKPCVYLPFTKENFERKKGFWARFTGSKKFIKLSNGIAGQIIGSDNNGVVIKRVGETNDCTSVNHTTEETLSYDQTLEFKIGDVTSGRNRLGVLECNAYYGCK